MNVSIDFETRSTVDLIKCGAPKYAEGELTRVMCLALKVDDAPTRLWIPEQFRHMISDNLRAYILDNNLWVAEEEICVLIEAADTITGHNVGFEYHIWKNQMVALGFPMIDIKKLRCSAAKAANFALPRSLKSVCKALHLQQQKDNVGHKVMLKLCKPRRINKADKEKFEDWKDRIFWNENPDEFEVLCRYCITDVDSEHGLSKALYDLSDFELKIFQLDQEINNRGVKLDIESVEKLIEKVKEAQNKMILEVQTITKGRLNSTNQTAELKKILSEQGVEVADVTKPSVAHALETVGLPPLAKRLLEIRQALSKSSTAKLDAMIRATGEDGRARGLLLYAGARTLRWAGRLIQPQNMPRDTYKSKDIESIVDLDNEMIEMLYGDVPDTASKCLRGMFIADEGKEFICGDLKSIEARVLAWVAGEEEVLEQYRAGKDIYKVNAENIYGAPYDQVDKEQRFVGKVAELSLGYQGHVGAFIPMAKQYGVEIESKRAKEIISAWRASRPMTVAFWKGVENAALLAVKTGQPQAYGRIQFGMRGNFLHYRLPNGELRAYAYPGTMVKETPYGVSKEVITFWGVASDKDQVMRGDKTWGMLSTYGGKITENIVQSIARDIIAEAMVRLEAAGYPTVLSVHDEVISEVPIKDNRSLDEYEYLMSVVPTWATGLPLGADVFRSKRYRK